MSTIFFDIFKKFYSNICSIILFPNSPVFKIQTFVLFSVKWENTDFLRVGGGKNQNVCSVFPAAHKLVHLHTNFIFNPLNKNPIKPSKIKHFTHFNHKNPKYRSQYRKPPLKSILSSTSHTNPNPQSESLSSYINTKS